MTQERQDGWHTGTNGFVGDREPRRWVFADHKVFEGEEHRFDCRNAEEASRVVKLLNKDPDLLAVARAAQGLLEHGDICGCRTCQGHADALRSALAKLP